MFTMQSDKGKLWQPHRELTGIVVSKENHHQNGFNSGYYSEIL